MAAILLLACSSNVVVAESGKESLSRAHDLDLALDSRWAGGANGGYYPIRVRLINLSRVTRSLTFRIENTGDGHFEGEVPRVEKQISIDGNATLKFTLSVPLISGATAAALRVQENGQMLDQLSSNISLPEPSNENSRPALLVISPPGGSRIELKPFEDAVSLVTKGGLWHRSGGRYRADDHAVVSSTLLPDSWLDYTSVDVVAVSLKTLQEMPVASRSAVLKWTEAGGTLLISEVGRPAAKSDDLARALELAERRATTDWRLANLETRVPLATYSDLSPVVRTPISPMVVEESESPIAVDTFGPLGVRSDMNVWSGEAEAFARRDLLLGRVYAFQDDAFQGSVRDWAWWMSSWPSSEWQWTQRFGMSARRANFEFMKFLIPGVGDVPVTAFLTLISIFTILIGPVNYLLLYRRKQLFLLVVTIPALAFMTTCALFAWAALADGFGTRSRLRSVTVVDQGRKTAVSLNRMSLFAGLAPSAGLSFSPDTAVFPVWSNLYPNGLDSGTVNWTTTQHLASGFLRSRQHAQFSTVVHRAERGRLEIRPGTDGSSVEVNNGFAWSFDALVIKDDAGKQYFGKNISAGASAKLTRATAEDLIKMRQWIEDRSPQFPEMHGPTNDPVWNRPTVRVSSGFGRGYEGPTEPIQFDGSLLERNIRLIRGITVAQPVTNSPDGEVLIVDKTTEVLPTIPNQSYYGIVRENPGIELGVPATTPSEDLHILLGRY